VAGKLRDGNREMIGRFTPNEDFFSYQDKFSFIIEDKFHAIHANS